MIYSCKQILLKNNQLALFRSPKPTDSQFMLNYLKTCALETDYILRYPEECNISIKDEELFLNNINDSKLNLMIVAMVDNEIAGNCQITYSDLFKTKHRATVAIALISKYWNLGIGSAMMKELIEHAKQQNIKQLELECVAGNKRALALYEKFNFKEFARTPNAIYLKNDTYVDLIHMVKQL